MIIPCGEWRPAAAAPKLDQERVHVWRVALNRTAKGSLPFSLLSDDEKSRAARFRLPRDRDDYTLARTFLRILLSQYVNVDPSRLRFTYSQHGKPELADEFGRGSLKFNLSHSNGMALCAVTRGRAVGIDIERVRDSFDYQEIARRFFAKNEPFDLKAMSADAFFRRWTRSEALAKAMGQGLDQFSTAAEEKTGWLITELDPAPGFVAAIAVEAESLTLECFDWETS